MAAVAVAVVNTATGLIALLRLVSSFGACCTRRPNLFALAVQQVRAVVVVGLALAVALAAAVLAVAVLET